MCDIQGKYRLKYGITRGDGIKGEILELIMSMDLDEETGMPKIRNKILVKGREIYFVDEFDSEDEIQQILSCIKCKIYWSIVSP